MPIFEKKSLNFYLMSFIHNCLYKSFEFQCNIYIIKYTSPLGKVKLILEKTIKMELLTISYYCRNGKISI